MIFLNEYTRKRIASYWKAYLWQALLSSLTLFILLLVLKMENTIVIASIGATAFVVFAMPKSRAAQTKTTLGGYCLGILCAWACSYLPQTSDLLLAASFALAVGCTSAMMLLTGYKHPPAAGAALGLMIHGINISALIAILISITLLSTIRVIMLRFLYDFSQDS